MTQPRFTNPVLGPRIVPIDEQHRPGDVLPNGRPAFKVTATSAMHRTRPPYTAAIDLGNFHGGDAVVAMAPGRVSFVEPREGIVRIDHGSGWSSGYGHQVGINVSPGQNVARGHLLGRVGNAGTAQIHLHFDISRYGERLDAWPLLAQNQEDPMKLPSAGYFATGKVGPGNRLRLDHTKAEGEVTGAVVDVEILGIVIGGTAYVLADGRRGNRWYIVRRTDTGDVRQVAHQLVTAITPTATLFSQIPLPAAPVADCSALENKLRAVRTAAEGAAQAIEAIRSTASP